MRNARVAVLPALLAAVFAGWCGNLLGGVTAPGSTTALVLLLATLAGLGESPWRDPLRLGRRGRWAPVALWLVAAASAWVSPVGRAALEAVVLLPAFLLLPSAVGRCWSTVAARRRGSRALAAAVLLLAAWALIAQLAGGGDAGAGGTASVGGGASAPAAAAPGGGTFGGVFLGTLAPLGHHTLFAAWIVILLPLALLPLREKTPWRWLAAAAAVLGLAAVAAGGSLAGGAGLACEALLAALWLGIPRLRRGREGGRSPAPSEVAAVPAAGAAAAGPAAGSAARLPAGWRWTAALALLGLALVGTQLPRLARIATLRDPSARVRAAYIEAGLAGWRERPWLGWGPGSVGWTAAWFLSPRPGLNPWGEAVGELHCLPVHLAYEMGALGVAAAAATAGAFGRRRWLERGQACDPGLQAAGCLGLAGAAVACLGTASLAVIALPLAATLAAGAALAGGQCGPRNAMGDRDPDPSGATASFALGGPRPSIGSPAGGTDLASLDATSAPRLAPGGLAATVAPGRPTLLQDRRTWRPAAGSALVWMYVVAAVAALLAPEAARWHYDRAVGASQAGRPRQAAKELAAAVRLDPAFPLYRMRLALLTSSGPRGRNEAATLAWQAARDGRGVGLLWLVAGILGRSAGEVWAPAAFEQSCGLDPLAPFPPFYLAASTPDAPEAPRLAARALLAEPRLLAAVFWEDHRPLLAQAMEVVRRWPGVDAGWKLAALAAAQRESGPTAAGEGATVAPGSRPTAAREGATAAPGSRPTVAGEGATAAPGSRPTAQPGGGTTGVSRSGPRAQPGDGATALLRSGPGTAMADRLTTGPTAAPSGEPTATPRGGPTVSLGLAIDMAGFTQSSSLHLFRRLPWPTRWPLVSLRQVAVAAVDLPPATTLPGTDGAPFTTVDCGGRADFRPAGEQSLPIR